MKLFLKKIFMVFAAFMVASSLYAQTAGFGIGFQETNLDLNFGQVFSVDLRLSLNQSICDDFQAELLVPKDIIVSSTYIASTSGASIGPSLTSKGSWVTRTVGGKDYTVMVVSFNPTVDNQSATFTISGFYTPDGGCAEQNETMLLGLISDVCSIDLATEELDVKMTTGDNLNASLISWNSNSYCDSKFSPLKVRLRISKTNVNTSYSSDIVLNKNGLPLKCIAVTRGRYRTADYFQNYNNIDEALIDNNYGTDQIKVSGLGLGKGSYSNEYMLYFEVLSPVTVEKDLQSIVKFYNNNCASDITEKTPKITVPVKSCSDDDIVKVPDINYYNVDFGCLNGACADPTTFKVQLDNSFKGTGKINYNLPVVYEMDVDPEVDLVDLNLATYYTIPGDIKFTYCVYDGDLDPLNDVWTPEVVISRGSDIKFDQGRPKSFRLTFESGIPELSSQEISIDYKLNTPAGYIPSGVSTFPVSSKISYSASELKSRDWTLKASTTYPGLCTGNELRDYIAGDDLRFSSITVDFNKVYTYMIEFENIAAVNEFKYYLNPYLEYLGNEMFYYGSSNQNWTYYNASDFQDLASFRTTSGLTTANVVFQPSTREFQFSSLGLPGQSCDGGNKRFFMTFQVRLLPTAPTGQKRNNPSYATYRSSVGAYVSEEYQYRPSWFTVPSNTAFDVVLLAQCSSDAETEDALLRSEEDYYFKYIIDNVGNRNLKDIIILGALPFLGENKLIDQTASGSNFSIPYSSIDNLKLSVINPDGSESSVISDGSIDLGPDWTIEHTTNTNFCWEDLVLQVPQTGCSSGVTWNSGFPSGSGYFRIKSPNGFSLTASQQLQLTVKGKIPSSVAIGSSANASFAANVVSTNNEKPFAKSNNGFASITISDISSCDPPPCEECITSFSPKQGEEYLLSAWVKEDYTSLYPDTYVNSGIQITFNNGADATLPVFKAKGPIIDGWQRIEQSFLVPAGAENIQINLVNEGTTGDVYYDDIRVHTFRGNMKSYVYDPSTQKLTAELDENNYATKYEYDDEGILIRVKKETTRGVMTIKESRNNQSKINK